MNGSTVIIRRDPAFGGGFFAFWRTKGGGCLQRWELQTAIFMAVIGVVCCIGGVLKMVGVM